MKKLFLFATIAAAGLFASCSSSDDAVSDALNSPIEDPNAPQAIQIGIGNMADMTTRGHGTVGGVAGETSIKKIWAGQQINVFMFTKDADRKSTLNLSKKEDNSYYYNNQPMITPGSKENLITGMGASAEVNDGQAMHADGIINYYPVEGTFDFFGYHGDDAVESTAEITRYKDDGTTVTGTSYADDFKWTVPFTINGTQDLMSTKAVLTATQEGIMSGKIAANQNNYYSAYSARQEVQPTLTFNHLLTRLQFKVKAGNDEAAGYVAGSAAVNAVHTENTLYTIPAGVITVAGATELDANATAQADGTYTYYQESDKTYREVVVATSAISSNTVKYTVTGTETPIADDATLEATQDAAAATGTTVFFVNNEKYVESNVTQVAQAAVLAGQDFDKAVKVKSISIESKNSGSMAVAWLEREDADKLYEMGMLPVADFATAADQGKWTAVIDDVTDPTNPVTTGYTWNAGLVDATGYAALSAGEQAVATCINGPMTDAAKITWGTTTATMSLKERPYAKRKTDPAPAAAIYSDFTDLQADYDALAALFPAPADFDEQVAALTATAATRETAFINKATYDSMTDAGKAKYDNTAQLMLKENLIDLTPTYPSIDDTKADAQAGRYDLTTNVGEALIVAPSTEDYKMRVTIQQDVPQSWTDPTQLSTKEMTYDLTIKAPAAGGFKINTSYNVILTVYSLKRIEVIAVITPWEDSHDDVNIGGDQ